MTQFPSRPRAAYGDVAAYAEILRPLITPWYSGYIYIINPQDNIVTTDMQAGTKTVTVNPLWNGPSRIQTIRRNLGSKETTNDTIERTVQFQADYAKDGTMPDIRPGFQIIVANGGTNQLLTQYQYVISGMINSSQAWNFTIFADANLEVNPHYVLPDGEPLYPDFNVFPSPNLYPQGE